MSLSVEELELTLGPREKYILHSSDIPMLRQWAMKKGLHPFDVQKMSAVELANLYADNKAVTNDIHDIILKVLQAVNSPNFDIELAKQVARYEIQQEILNGATIKHLIEELAPRKLSVETLSSSVILEGLQHYMTETIIKIVALNHPVMMVGPAGCGKTTIGEQAAKALNLQFYITSTINDTHELIGFIDGYGKYHSTPFRQAFEFGGLWVADEIDAWDANALLAANSALANGYAAFPDQDRPVGRHSDFRMVATANTFGSGADRVYIGRNELDAASLDRFATVNVDYDYDLERSFANGKTKWLEYVWEIRKKINEKKIRHVASSRAISMGSKALIAGMEWDDVCEIYLFKGMSETDREKLG